MRGSVIIVLLALAALSGCDQLGIPTPASQAAQREANAKAIGSACRHAGRAIEDCYTLNKKAEKAAVFAGWKEMNDYMRENQIEPVAPVIPTTAPAAAKAAASAASDDAGDGQTAAAADAADADPPEAAAAAHGRARVASRHP